MPAHHGRLFEVGLATGTRVNLVFDEPAQGGNEFDSRQGFLVGEPAVKTAKGDGFRLLVTGGRQFAGKNFTFRALDLLHADLRLGVIIEGGAIDAYSLSNEWAHRNDVRMQTVALLASSKLQGKRAGHERNAHMLAVYKPQAVLVFPGGRGTLNMESLATAAAVPVLSATKLLADPAAIIAALKQMAPTPTPAA